VAGGTEEGVGPSGGVEGKPGEREEPPQLLDDGEGGDGGEGGGAGGGEGGEGRDDHGPDGVPGDDQGGRSLQLSLTQISSDDSVRRSPTTALR
jgi:hypothetical protein